jgi:hypothetical protein
VLEPIASTVKALSSTIAESIKAITFPQYPSIEAIEAGPEGGPLQPLMKIGEIATAYLKRSTEKENTTDKIFSNHDTGGKFYIGNSEIMLDGDNITLMGSGIYRHSWIVGTYC